MDMFDQKFYQGKRVLVTGHTGFKGAWLCCMLTKMGAQVTGYSLKPPTEPSLFALAGVEKSVCSVIGDVRDFAHLRAVIRETKPQVIFHLAAQPIVRESYRDPRGTYETNVMGTVNLMECVRENLAEEKSILSVLNVTTDKVYKNNEWVWGYRENEPLDGYDPYSNSKSCSELVTHSYCSSFFTKPDGSCLLPVSTARAGNVIGGGDFAKDRIIPDCVRAAVSGNPIVIRNPNSIRPYQHVLEPLYAYLMIAARQAENPALAGNYNVGPDECDCLTTGELAQLFVQSWGEGVQAEIGSSSGPHEANYLKLDCSLLKQTFGWKPRWSARTAVEKTVAWSRCWKDGADVRACVNRQIDEFLNC